MVMTAERRAKLITYYQHEADYYGARATEAGTRYMNTGDRLDGIWFRHWLRASLRATSNVIRLKGTK